MKRILSGCLLVLLVAVVVVGGTAYVLLFHGGEEPEDVTYTTYPTMVDSSGEAHLVVVDPEGTSYAVVTDAEGNRYAAQYSGNEIGATVGQINDQVPLRDLPTTTDPASQIVVTNNPNDYMGDIGTTTPAVQQTAPVATTTPSADTVQTTVPAQNTTEVPVTTDPDLVAYRIEKYQKIFASGTYFMEITTNDPDLGDTPISMAIKHGDMFVDTTIEGMKCQMIYDSRKDTMYLVFNDWKKYCKLPDDLLGEDFDMSEMMADFGMDDIGEITVSKVDLNGQQLILESYVSSADGSTVNYYFNGDELVRRDSISTSGAIDSIYISKFMNDVPDSYFEIPDGYGYLNLSWMGALM
ncbi:MAG: hypothetical protein IKV21_03090 [Clostridia bacterium]|nr:hypothetical protein [Clostridia bacterium]